MQEPQTAPGPGSMQPGSRVGSWLVFGTTVFLSAFLLFQVQPMIGRFILPWFGASPGVWATCMLFFQVLLLGGYAYAHVLVSRLRPSRQAAVHGALLGLALLTLPITPDEGLKPVDEEAPTARILWALAVSVGVPYLLLSSTGPLIQGWFARLHPGRSPYRLYALSNVGSLLALLSYPFVFERYLRLHVQTGAWSVAYVVFALLCGACALRLARGAGAASGLRRDEVDDPTAEQPEPEQPEPEDPVARPSGMDIFLWLGLSACGSALLLATTNQLCLDVAAVPFLWVLPLSLYLLTFILCFDSDRWYVRPLFCFLMPIVLAFAVKALQVGVDLDLLSQVVVFASVLFVCCMCCHGELARLRPDPRYLTLYFLVISIGGALGGLFVAVVAPNVFDGFHEYHLTLVACYALVFGVILREKLSPGAARWGRPGSDLWTDTGAGVAWLGVVVVIALALGALFDVSRWVEQLGSEDALRMRAWLTNVRNLAWALPLLVLIFLDAVRWRRGAAFGAWWLDASRQALFATSLAVGVGLAALIGGLGWTILEDDEALARGRNFYGVLSVREWAPRSPLRYWSLYNGRINHGFQYQEDRRDWPVSYYGPESGLGVAIRLHPQRGAPSRSFRIGIIGLGTGVAATYVNARVDTDLLADAYVGPARLDPPDVLRYYEINPLVRDWADAHFSYLEDARARGADVEVFMGDARIVMERQVAAGEKQDFDVLGVDAFTGDAIPIHLLTLESLRVYFEHLKPDGILAVHVSNRFLDLLPVVRRLGNELGKGVIYIENKDDDARGVDGSDWVLLTNNVAFLKDEAVREVKHELPPPGPLWTDDFSSVFELIKFDSDDEEPEPELEDDEDPEEWEER